MVRLVVETTHGTVRGEVVEDLAPDAPLRAAMAERYRGQDTGLEAWAATALAVRLTPEA